VSVATAYRYVHEAIDVIAVHAPDLSDVLARGLREGWAFVCLDSTLIFPPHTAAHPQAGPLWYSGKHKQHGGDIQVLTDPTGYPIWVRDVELGSTHDITAARTHALPALYPAAARGLPTLTDKGYAGAGIGIQVPTKAVRRQPDWQRDDQRAPLTGRTSERPAQRHLESTRTRHPRPMVANRRHPRRRSRTTTTPPSVTGPVRKPQSLCIPVDNVGGT
jgi:hypothetical protein